MNLRRARTAISLIALVILVVVAKFGSFDKTTEPPRDTRTVPAGVPSIQPQTTNRVDTAKQAAPATDLTRIVPDASERNQIETTLRLIASNGPFPHERDGIVFSNREGRLPTRPRGYYREYTVETPGASTRGARRIIRGDRGETYYTRDHYGSFVRIDGGGSDD